MWVLAYTAFAWAVHPWLPGEGRWPYFFMALNTWLAVMWYCILALLHLLAWGVVHSLSRLKACARPGLVEMPSGPLAAEDSLLDHHPPQQVVVVPRQ